MKKLRMTRTLVALLVFSILIYLTSFSSIAAPMTGGAGTSGLIVIVQGGELLYRSPKLSEPLGMIEETSYFIVEGISAEDNTIWKLNYSGEAAWISAEKLTAFGMYHEEIPGMHLSSGLEYDTTPHTYYVTEDISDHVRAGNVVQAYADTDKYGMKTLVYPLDGLSELDAEYLEPTWVSPSDCIYFTEEYEEWLEFTAGEEITLSVHAESVFGGEISYAWYGGNQFFSVTGQGGDTVSIPANAYLDGVQITVVASTPFGASISHTFHFVSPASSVTDLIIELSMPSQTAYAAGVSPLSASDAITTTTPGINVHPESQIAVTKDGLTLFYLVISPEEGVSLQGLSTGQIMLTGAGTENMRVISVSAYESFEGEGIANSLGGSENYTANLLNPDGTAIVCIASLPGPIAITKNPGSEIYTDNVFRYSFSASAQNASSAAWYLLYPTASESWESSRIDPGNVYFEDPFEGGDVLLGYAYLSFSQGQASLTFENVQIYDSAELFQGYVVCVFKNAAGEIRVTSPATLGWGVDEDTESTALASLGIQNRSADFASLSDLLNQAQAEHFTEFRVTSGYCSTAHTVTAYGDAGTQISYTMPEGTHSWTEWETTGQPTCTTDGVMIHYCELCGNSETITIPAFGHTDQEGDGICDICGKALTDTSANAPASQDAGSVVFYTILEGASSVFTRGSQTGLRMVTDMPYGKFAYVKVDEDVVSPGSYQVLGVNAEIVFTPEYLETLETGPHFLEIQALDGEAQCLFAVAEKDGTGILSALQPGDGSAETENFVPVSTGGTSAIGGGNGMILLLLCLILVLMIIGLILLILIHARKKKQQL